MNSDHLLTHWPLVTWYGGTELSVFHQAIAWTDVDLVKSCGIHLRSLSLEILYTIYINH